MKLVTFVTESYGCLGGIAKFNRDFTEALSQFPATTEVISLPRKSSPPIGKIPGKVYFDERAAGLLPVYALHCFRHLFPSPRLIVCGHIHLLPLAILGKIISGAPVVLIIHGIDAWVNRHRFLLEKSLRRLDFLVSVSAFTRDRFIGWSGFRKSHCIVLPNCIDLSKFGVGKTASDLRKKHDLIGKRVLYTMTRMASDERYKGIDEVLEVFPKLGSEFPDLVYLIGGTGDDRPRLEEKAKSLGLGSKVRFLGLIEEEKKVEYYRLADVFVMPSRGEGFGIVFLEALACGTPVVAGNIDGSTEALLNGKMGILVNPGSLESISEGIRKALVFGRKQVPAGLEYFSREQFQIRVHRILEQILRKSG